MAVVVNGGTVGGISLIDPISEMAMGPFLSGLLGPATSLLDCVVANNTGGRGQIRRSKAEDRRLLAQGRFGPRSSIFDPRKSLIPFSSASLACFVS
jgi:hypothetical protein